MGKSSQENVGAATPTKICKRGRKPNVNVQKANSSCRFCGVNFTSGGGRASFEIYFRRREELKVLG